MAALEIEIRGHAWIQRGARSAHAMRSIRQWCCAHRSTLKKCVGKRVYLECLDCSWESSGWDLRPEGQYGMGHRARHGWYTSPVNVGASHACATPSAYGLSAMWLRALAIGAMFRLLVPCRRSTLAPDAINLRLVRGKKRDAA